MSEQAEIASLREKIKEAKRNEMFGYAIAFVGLLVFWFTVGFYNTVSGLVIIVCLVGSFYYSYRGAKLRKQLHTMAFG